MGGRETTKCFLEGMTGHVRGFPAQSLLRSRFSAWQRDYVMSLSIVTRARWFVRSTVEQWPPDSRGKESAGLWRPRALGRSTTYCLWPFPSLQRSVFPAEVKRDRCCALSSSSTPLLLVHGEDRLSWVHISYRARCSFSLCGICLQDWLSWGVITFAAGSA